MTASMLLVSQVMRWASGGIGALMMALDGRWNSRTAASSWLCHWRLRRGRASEPARAGPRAIRLFTWRRMAGMAVEVRGAAMLFALHQARCQPRLPRHPARVEMAVL